MFFLYLCVPTTCAFASSTLIIGEWDPSTACLKPKNSLFDQKNGHSWPFFSMKNGKVWCTGMLYIVFLLSVCAYDLLCYIRHHQNRVGAFNCLSEARKLNF